MLESQLLWDIFMYVGLSGVGWLLYRMLSNKPLLPEKMMKIINKKKNLRNDYGSKKEEIELNISIKELLGIKEFHGDLIEIEEGNGVRRFVGVVKVEQINYLLRSYEEQAETDNAYEHLLASLTLGPGREVDFAPTVCSRPIDLGDQLRPYEEAFPNLDPTAQRYGETMFFPFMREWQQTVDEFDYQCYIPIILRYTEKMIEDLDEESILIKARNEFGRLANNIRVNYRNMGGLSKICAEYDLYEALYFSLNKQTGTLSHFRYLMEQEGVLSPFVNSDYTRDSYRYVEDEEVNSSGNETIV